MIDKTSALFVLFTVLFLKCLDFTDGEDLQKIFTPDYTYVNQTKSLYKVHTNKLNFTDARAKCESEGASLWYPEDQVEAEAVVHLWKEEAPSNYFLLIGITDLETRGYYQTLDHRPIHDVFSKWAAGEPDNGRGVDGEERCLVILKQVVLNDHRCNVTFNFVCKKNLKYLDCTKKVEAVKSDVVNCNGFIATSKKYSCRSDHFRTNRLVFTFFQQKIYFLTRDEKNYKFSPKGYTYLNKSHSFYKIHTIQKTAKDAEETCKMEGASFWYPENKAEADEVIAFWNQVQPNFGFVYIAVTDLKTKGVYEANDGRSLDGVYNKWAPGEPNHGNSTREERCLILKREGILYDDPCNKIYPFICKRSVDSLDCMNGSQTHTHMTSNNYYPKDYTYVKNMKSFYKIHTIKRNVTDAEIQCKKEGATFWYPEDRIEADAVISLWHQVLPNLEEWLYIAVNDLKTKGVFQTIDGRSFDDVYNKWGPGEPNDGALLYPEERCVTLKREGVLNDYLCDQMLRFVCKKSLGSTCNYKCDLPNHGSQITNTFFRNDYTYLDKNKSFYKIHTTQRDVSEAERRCKSEGATFWYPENQAEVDAVIAFWGFSEPTLPWVYVAIRDLKTKGTYLTNDGRPIEDVYNVWAVGEPNSPEERCIILRKEGVYNDHVCDTNLPFICKKTLNSFCIDQCNSTQAARQNFSRCEKTMISNGIASNKLCLKFLTSIIHIWIYKNNLK